MRKKTAALFAIACVALASGCSQESAPDGAGPGGALDAETREIVENLKAAGFPDDDVAVVDGAVYAGRDAVVTLAASREMLEAAPDGSSEEQYRTNNLVSQNIGTICVNGAAFTGVFSDALDRAIANYNNEGLVFQMRRIGGNAAGCGAVIRMQFGGPPGGVAGFPSGGRPFGTVTIGTGTSQFGVDTVEHVITHELGHCIGFRHSDFFNRNISCGPDGGGGESTSGGANLIPGTPSGAVVGGSLMNSCFRASETGEFTSSDRTALQALYGG